MSDAGASQRGRSKRPHWREYAALAVAAIAALAASFAAAASAYQAKVADEASRRQLRAYVGVVPIGVDDFDDSKKRVLKFIRRNYGATPAYNVFTPSPTLEVIRIGAALPTTYNTQRPKVETATLFPGQESVFRSTGGDISVTQIELVRSGKEYQAAYYGVVYYTDAFGSDRYTRFCWLFRGSTMTDKDVDVCLGHNDSN